MNAHETRIERETREITEIAEVLVRDKLLGTTVTNVWAEALKIWRIQFDLGELEL